jgi:hypothetical protein
MDAIDQQRIERQAAIVPVLLTKFVDAAPVPAVSYTSAAVRL